MKKIYYMLLLAVISMTFVSCDEHSVYWDTPDYRYIDNILGTWESYYGYDSYGEYDIRGYDIERFDFYGNYLGRYYYYSAMGWTYINFQWAASENKISIWYENGDFESMYWGINHYGDLVLSYDWKYREYTVFRPAGYYYEQGKNLDPSQAKSFDPATDVKPRSATRASSDKNVSVSSAATK